MQEELLYMLDTQYPTIKDFLSDLFSFVKNKELKERLLNEELSEENDKNLKPSEYFLKYYRKDYKYLSIPDTIEFYKTKDILSLSSIIYTDLYITEGVGFTDTAHRVAYNIVNKALKQIGYRELVDNTLEYLNKNYQVFEKRYKLTYQFGGKHKEVIFNKQRKFMLNEKGDIIIPLEDKEFIVKKRDDIIRIKRELGLISKYRSNELLKITFANYNYTKLKNAIKRTWAEVLGDRILISTFLKLPYYYNSCGRVQLDIFSTNENERICNALDIIPRKQ